eukprot:COSAG01_NODE_76_length_28332_cov_298.876992_19_plen_790_part_00
MRLQTIVGFGRIYANCPNESSKCGWPTWLKGTTTKATCCIDSDVMGKFRTSATGVPTELVSYQQYDPRVRSWYYTAVEKFVTTQQTFGWSEIFPRTVGIPTLQIVATIVIPGPSGNNGSAATAGRFDGGWFTGSVFSSARSKLNVSIDSAEGVVIDLYGLNLTSVSTTVVAINEGLAKRCALAQQCPGTSAGCISSNVPVACATATKGRIRIQSATTGSNSTIRVDTDNRTTELLFGTPVIIDGVDAQSGSYIGHRVPHAGRLKPANFAGGEQRWNFNASEQLVVVVDDIEHSLKLSGDLTADDVFVNFLNSELAGSATASVTAGGHFRIVSATTGRNSTVQIQHSLSGKRAQQLLAPVVSNVIGVDVTLENMQKALQDQFVDTQKLLVMVLERSTGYVVGSSVPGTKTSVDGKRTCATSDTLGSVVSEQTKLLQDAALLLESTGYSEITAKVDNRHFIESLILMDELAGSDLNWILVLIHTLTCLPGQYLQQQRNSVQCAPCPVGSFSPDGLGCTLCSAGFQAMSVQSVTCTRCDTQSYSPSEGRAVCLLCPSNTRSNAERTGCHCLTGSYNATSAVHVCFAGDFDQGYLNSLTMSTHKSATAHDSDCDNCPKDKAGDDCLQCIDELTLVAPGYNLLPPTAIKFSAKYMSVFRCHDKMEIAVKRCPGTQFDPSHSVNLSTNGCAHGYQGFVCGQCAPGFGSDGGQECTPCHKEGIAWIWFVVIVIGVGALCKFKQVYWKQTFKPAHPNFTQYLDIFSHLPYCIFQPLRILITYSQVTSQLGDVLNFQL